MAHPPDILKLLGRSDKHFLGGGNRLIWAPVHPLYAERGGFWDTAHYYNYELGPLFSWVLLDEAGVELPLRLRSRRWNPATLTQSFAAPLGRGTVTVIESKSILPNDVASCELVVRLRGIRTARVHLVAFTALETGGSGSPSRVENVQERDGTLSFIRHCSPPNRPEIILGTVLAVSPKRHSYAVQLSEGSLPPPAWSLTPFYEKFTNGRLPNTAKTTGVTDDGVLFLSLHAELAIHSGSEEHASIGCALSPSVEESRLAVRSVMKEASPAAFSVAAWEEYFCGAPRLECSDEFLQRYYYYRWYGLRLNTIRGGEGNYSTPAVCEGIGYFRAPISYSAPCHVLENRWRHQEDLAQGSILTFLNNQREDGGFRGYIDVNYYRQEMFYHANWGRALLELHALHPSKQFFREVYDGFAGYARYFDRERDSEQSGLYDIDNHYETGQEYMHRYTAVNAQADRENWGEVFRLKGVDVTTYIYELKRALATVARTLGRPGEAELWEIEADRIRLAMRERMWAADEGMFFDVDPSTGKRTGVKAATCFYPYVTDIVSEEHLAGLKAHLLNPREFWTPYPVPSSPLDDAMFSAEPEWKGKRMNCPWNGRVWPMTNSHMVEVLAQSAIRFHDAGLRRAATHLISTFIRMMCFDGDPSRPNCFEHYNPLTGTPSLYRGIDDYQHSWVVDLIIKYVCGIRPSGSHVLIDPFPFGLAQLCIDDVFIAGHRLRVEIARSACTVWMDGARRLRGTLGNPLTLDLE